VRAIAHYITSLSPHVDEPAAAEAAQRQSDRANAITMIGLERGRRTFETACAVCHDASGGVGHFGVRPLMGLNTSVAQAKPDNLLHVLHNGIDRPATAGLGYMPGFRDVYDDTQMAELAAYIRARYAPDQPKWQDLEKSSAQIRHAAH
jgi:nicotinate dehydrogenase subunit B